MEVRGAGGLWKRLTAIRRERVEGPGPSLYPFAPRGAAQ